MSESVWAYISCPIVSRPQLDPDGFLSSQGMLTLRPSCGITMGKKDSLKSLLLRAWRERWDEQVWGIAIKQVCIANLQVLPVSRGEGTTHRQMRNSV